MFSSSWPAPCAFMMKLLALLIGLAAAGAGWRAALLWHAASLVPLPPFDPPAASLDDAAAVHILSYSVQRAETAEAIPIGRMGVSISAPTIL